MKNAKQVVKDILKQVPDNSSLEDIQHHIYVQEKEDLEGIAEHIARDSKHYAAAIVLETRDASRSLVEMAERGRKVPEFHDLMSIGVGGPPSERFELLDEIWARPGFRQLRGFLASA
ncbi:MAG: type II toxin-antitoxin system RelE/ParE family toxin [Deltaproteobacteria bacterium]|nr:type II toxin-antitoxin system RelE/ParE family toxin [Deltaproteobacteria bacterium]MBI3293629.1 type II toxin-antitoxin system RelE/ParE family toxin [Deltaproteobacteria bacterium]